MPGELDARTDLPIGTVTFLRTDVEGSMAHARTLGSRWDAVNATHLGLIRRAVDAHGGVCVRTEGDAFFGAFPEAGAAVVAAIDAQRALADHAWPPDAMVHVRMGLHSGAAHLAGDDYGGYEVNRAARIAAAGHGGQVVLSESTRLLAEAVLTDGVGVLDLGRHVLRDVLAPEHLYQLDIPGLRAEFPPLRTSQPNAGNLPVRMTSFLGREGDLDALRSLVAASRLVTLTGPGGIGKSSLAVELARSLTGTVRDGAWFVPLDEVSDPGQVATAVARALGLFDGPDRPAADGLKNYLADRSTLLVLDNFEHLMAAAGDVAAILRSSPGTRILVTSRAPLHLAGEQEFPVRPVEAGETCADLFSQRARAVRPGWELGNDAEVVAEICALLDGLPLGIELAAARVSLLHVRAIRDRLAARLPLPGSGPRDAPDRQRTLDRAIAWSHDLLAPPEQRLLHDLAVFEGSFDIDQATAVSGHEAFDRLATLVEHSLVTREIDDQAIGVRFRLLQTIRAFALERLSEDGREGEARARHAEAFVELAEEAARHLPGADQPQWLDRLRLDHANLRFATRWAIDAGNDEIALRLVAALWRYWQLDGHLVEARSLADAALRMPGAEEPTTARLAALPAAGGIAYWDGRPQEALDLYAAQLALARTLADPVAEVDAIFNLSWGRFIAGDSRGAESMIADARARYEALGDRRGAARTTWARGTVQLQSGDPDAAARIFRESLREFEEIGDAPYHAMTLGSLAWSEYFAGNVREGSRWLIQGFAETYRLRDVASTVIQLPVTAIMAIEAGQFEEAAVILGAVDALSIRFGVRTPGGLEALIARGNPRARVREALSQEKVDSAMERGRLMSLGEVAALVERIGASLSHGQPEDRIQ